MKWNLKKVVCVMMLFSFFVAGCSTNSNKEASNPDAIAKTGLVYEESKSPNKEYVTAKEDVVHYDVQVYQNSDYEITVRAKSNSEFFEPLEYVLKGNQKIAKTDVAITWETLSGDTNTSQENQLAIASVSILADGKVVSERKINFVNKGIDVVVDTIHNN